MAKSKTVPKLKQADPFEVSLDWVRSLDQEEYGILLDRLQELYGDWLKERLKETDSQAIVVCDHRVIHTSQDRYSPSDEELEGMEKKLGRPCYVIMGEPLIEELAHPISAWSDLGEGDYYPTLELFLGDRTWDDERVFRDGRKVASDFDTGNPIYTAFSEEICADLTKEVARERRGYHLGKGYSAYLRTMKLGVIDGISQRCMEKVVEGIKDWDDPKKNPYKLANPKREGFIGRDIMLQLDLKITLNPKQRESEWELL